MVATIKKQDFTKAKAKIEQEPKGFTFPDNSRSNKKLDAFFEYASPNKLEQINVDRLIPYSNPDAGYASQPFKVRDDDEMKSLVEDIKENGILTPLMINRKGNDFIILSGHRRAHAAKLAGIKEVPCIVKEYDDVMAATIVIQTNLLNREKILPSERALAYKLKMDVLRQQGARKDLTSSHGETLKKGVRSDTIVAQEEGVSRAQINRYIQLTKLLPELLEMVDKEILPFRSGISISSLPDAAQKKIYDVLKETGKTLSTSTAEKIKSLPDYSMKNLRDIIAPTPKKQIKESKPVQKKKDDNADIERYISIPFSELAGHFPKEATDEDIIKAILKSLSIAWTNNI